MAPHNSSQTPAPAPAPALAPVTVLGLGLMGTALATALLRAGHPTTVWNRTRSRTGPLTAQGATPADTPAEAVSASPLVVVCLTTYDDVTGLLQPHTTALAGRTLVNVTNGTPAQARKFAIWAQEHGIQYVDGGIMAVPQMIGTPAAYVLYSGDQEAYASHRPALAALGGTRWTGTDPGLAALYDLSLLTGMYGMVMGVAQSFALIRSQGIEAREFAPLLSDWLNAMTAGLVPGTAEAVDTGRHLTDVSSLAVNQAAFPNLLTAFADQGVRPELFAPMRELLDRAVAEGHADDGFSRLVELLRV
ncbi:NAD(P)-binding domain-containing protein [Streptomyces sp. BV286]|uniref:NAD(P)-dependent oxidoreductase n=1 Tax=Streptomyces sp. BV286 TaxID=2849672 RepID=UPI001C2E85CF|nr:NAD(P)-binding domain-containing protein [Streptomyces sp. BV286]MBV1938456.1 NAD(P)-binding domain-containing protein [Streptomyces sp. BV286]